MKIFLSYKREDRDFVEELRSRLIDWGYATWMDIYDLPKGARWPDEIDKGLRESSVVIGVMSPRAVESRNVKNEWDWAIVNETRLIPLMLEKCYVPMNYVSINYIDFTKNKANGFEELKAALDAPQAPAPADPYREYLQQLYERINTFLAQKIIARRPDEETMPEPLRLRSERTPNAVDALFEKRDEIDPLFAIGGIEQDEPEQVYEDFERAFRFYEGRVLLLGEPGAGKTITLLHFGRDAVVRRMQNPSLPLPTLGIVPTWDAEKRPSLAEWLGSAYGAPENAARVIEEGKTLLLLDGLDELGEEREDFQTGEQYDPRKRFAEIIPANNYIIVTCRVKDYEGIGEKIALKGAVTLKPLDDEQMRAYLAEQGDLWAAVQADERLREMLRTPLLLSFLAFAYRDMSDEERQHLRDLSHSPSDLRDKIFETYVRRRYEHEERKLKVRGETMLFTLEKIYEVLGQAGINNLRDYRRGLLTDSETDILFKDSIGKMLDDKGVQLFFQSMVLLHLVIPRKERGWGDTFRFIHLLLRDHFISAYSLPHLWSTDSDLRYMVLALIWIRDNRALEPLLAIFEERQLEEYSRHAVMQYFAQLGDSRTVPLLITALGDEDAYVRSISARGLGRLNDIRAVQPLMSILNDSDADVRSSVAQALGNLGDPNAVQRLIPLLSDVEESRPKRVCDFAAEALERISTLEALAAVKTWRQQALKVEKKRQQQALKAEKKRRQSEIKIKEGSDHFDKMEYVQAIECYQRALSLIGKLGDVKTEGSILFDLGLAYDVLGQSEQAINAYQQRVQLNPDSVAHVALARLYKQKGEAEIAASHLARAREIIPDSDYYNLACLECVVGNIDIALQYLERAIVEKSVRIEWAEQDPDLAAVRNHPHFRKVLGLE